MEPGLLISGINCQGEAKKPAARRRKMKPKLKGFAFVLALVAIAVIAAGAASAKKHGSRSPWIGVYTQAIDEDLKEAFDSDRCEGALIVDVVDDSPAEEAGLRRKDIIIKFNGKKVDNPDMLVDLVRSAEVGDKAEIVYIRKGKEKTATIEITRRPKADWKEAYFIPRHSPKSITRSFSFSSVSDSYIGVAIQDLNDQLGEYFGVGDGEGALVTEVFEDSPAEDAGLKAGDVIISADGEAVAEMDDLKDIIGEKEEGDKVEIGFIRKGEKKKVTVEVTEDSFGSSTFSRSMNLYKMNMPKFKRFGGQPFYDQDIFLYDEDEYEESMQELREELKKEINKLREELRELKSKLE